MTCECVLVGAARHARDRAQVGTLLHSVDVSLCAMWVKWCMDNQRRVRVRLATSADTVPGDAAAPSSSGGSGAGVHDAAASRAAAQEQQELNAMIADVAGDGERVDEGVIVAGGRRYFVGDTCLGLERLWHAFVGPVQGLAPDTLAQLAKAGRFAALLQRRGAALLEGAGADDAQARPAAGSRRGSTDRGAPPPRGVAGTILGGPADPDDSGADAEGPAPAGGRTTGVERGLECLRNAARIKRAIAAASRVAAISYNDAGGSTLSVPILTEGGEADTECNARIAVGDAINCAPRARRAAPCATK